MEWSRVKSILICVFLVVNLVLAKVYIDGNSTKVVVDDATIDNTIKVLTNKNINIDKSIIEKASSDVAVFNISNRHKTTKDFVSLVLGDGAEFETEGETVFYKVKCENEKALHKELKKLGFFETYKYKRTVKKDGDKVNVAYNVYNNGLCVYDTYIKAEIVGDNATVTVKNWLGDVYSNTGYSSVQTAPEALICFSNAVSFETNVNITAMEKGYIAGDRNGELRTTNVIPVWKITCDGYNYFVDMRNGDYLKL